MAGEAVVSFVLEGLLSKLSSPILDEFGLLWGVKKEKQKLQSNLSRIKAVLQDAERQQIDLMADKDRLGKLKDVAYDAEDLVDEFLVEALRRKVENQDGMGRKVGNFFSPANPLAFRFKIAHKMKELRERFEELAEENNNFQSAVGVARIQPQIPNPRDTASSVPVWGVYGRDYQKENYIDSLINSGNEEVLSVIPIVGMGGLGKTTLAQYVYDDERVVTHFNLKMWVYVSEDFDVGRLLARILQSATNKSTPTDGSSMDLLNTRVKENLSGKRYLLVLDDVWNEDSEKWDRLRTALQCGAKGSKVLVTTRNDTVARRMEALPRPPLATLSPVESWTLFEEVAHPPTSFVSIGEEIVRKCGGVPLAIKTLGGMLRNETSEREWQSVRDSELWKQTDNEGGILSIIRLSYDHLTSSLKQCFAYCAVIPKGHSFYKDVLIKQWIAQGFIHSDDENELLEEEGEKYFNALLRRSLFQVDVDNYSYKMHDLIHDLLKSVAGKECLVVEESMMNDLTRHLALCNDETRHLALCNDEWVGDPKNLDALKKCKKLRSMITYGYYRRIDINVCLSFRCLRVLDLSNRSICFLPNSIDKLRHLRYFDISHTRITELPETICDLHNLQTLKVFGIPLKKWPKNMKRMISLRHIEFNGGGDFLSPKGIGELTCLRTLSKFVINEESEPGMEELKGLNQLMGDISIEGLENIRNGACAREADLKAKKHLHSLHLRWNRPPYVSDRNAQEVINNLEPHSNLKKLLVRNYIGLSFPSWMMMLSNLIHIELRGCIRCEQLPPFGQLPLLESLEIYEMSAIKYIVKSDGSYNNKDIFRSLRRLVLSELPNLERWSSPQENGDGDEQRREEDEQVILGRLFHLRISNCPNLIRLPKLLLPALEFLKMNGVGCDRIDLPKSKSLKVVSLTSMPNLEMWSSREADDDQKVIYPLLNLEVRNCPKMVRLPHLLPSLKELIIVKTDERLLGSLANYTSLVRLDIIGFPEVMHLLEEIGPTHANNLHTWKIADCPKLISISHQLKYLHSLEELRIYYCPELVLPSLDGSQEQQPCPPLNSLKKLVIRESCEKQVPGEGMIMTSLEELKIRKCWNLESLFSEGLQNLTSLDIEECPKAWSSPEWLRNLTSLKKLRGVVLDAMTSLTNPLENLKSLEDLFISSGPDMTDLPEWIGNLASLTHLWIINCPSIRSLPESLGNLQSLSNMSINSCQALTELPKGLQRLTNLRKLRIWECPDLKRRLCKNWKEWKKVAHVPEIYIDGQWYSWEVEHPSLMQSLKKGCNEFDKKLHFPTCTSSSSP